MPGGPVYHRRQAMRVSGRVRLVLLLSGVVTGCATTKPSPDALRVDAFEVRGAKEVRPTAITERLVTAATPWWSRWFPWLGGTEWFDTNTWQADLRRITRFYETQGYFQARILEDVVTHTPRGSVRVHVRVFEGTPAKLTSLQVEGLDSLPQQKTRFDLRSPLKLGVTFLEDDWTRAKSLMESGLQEEGYAQASVKGEASVDLDTATVAARLTAEPGLRYRFGGISAPTTGGIVPPQWKIDEASREIVRGAWYSDSALARAQTRLFQMGVFSAVKINRGIPNSETGEIPVVIDVREAPLISTRFGGGFSGDVLRNDVHLFGEYVDRNFGLTRFFSPGAVLDKFVLRGRAGWAVLPNIFDYVRRALEKDPTVRQGFVGDLSVQYEVPRAFGIKTVNGFSSLTLNRTLDAAFDYVAGEGKLGLRWWPRVDLSIEPSLNANVYVLNTEIVRMATGTPSAAVGCPVRTTSQFFPRIDELCFVGFFQVNADFDRRDNTLQPKEGTYVSTSAQLGFAKTNKETPFIRFLPEARGYLSFGHDKWVTLAGKVKAGWLFGLGGGETPIVSRFFSGGSAMRGFNQRRLSPMAIVATGTGPLPSAEQVPFSLGASQNCQKTPTGECVIGTMGAAVPVGGNGLLEGSLETRIELTDALVLSFFVDVGMVTVEPLFVQTNFANDLYVAVGTGLRLKTPIGPVRADFGFRLPFIGGPLPITSNQSAATAPTFSGCYFNLGNSGSTTYGGAAEGLCTIHVSVGEAF